MHTLNSFLYSLLLTLILSFDIVCATGNQTATKQISSTNNTISDRSGILEGGDLPEKKDNNKLDQNGSNITPPKVSNINGSLLLSNHGSTLVLVTPESPVNKSDQKPLETGKTNGSISNHLATNTTSVASNLTSTKPTITYKPKPLITEHDNDADKAEVKSDVYTPKIPSIDAIEKKNKRANYVIPIVGVILSVPLVAIVISVIYKRGADWWQHRNYRRMDFLIEGMYNN